MASGEESITSFNCFVRSVINPCEPYKLSTNSPVFGSLVTAKFSNVFLFIGSILFGREELLLFPDLFRARLTFFLRRDCFLLQSCFLFLPSLPVLPIFFSRKIYLNLPFRLCICRTFRRKNF